MPPVILARYIRTTRRITSGEELKYRNGLGGFALDSRLIRYPLTGELRRCHVALTAPFWAFVMIGSVVIVVIAGDKGPPDVWGRVLVACLTALASAAVFLWLWQRHGTSSTRDML